MATMLRKIPSGITADDFIEIRNLLRQVLNDAGARAVVMRLNKTGETWPCPIFVGWVEDDALAQRRIQDTNEPEPGLFRFGDSNYSKMYNETVSADPGVATEKRWGPPYTDKDDQSKTLLSSADVYYQRYMGIVTGQGADRRCAGTLSVALSERPDDTSSLDQVLNNWAVDSKSPLVQFLQDHFVLGGRAV
jgi:hypothetical protein